MDSRPHCARHRHSTDISKFLNWYLEPVGLPRLNPCASVHPMHRKAKLTRRNARYFPAVVACLALLALSLRATPSNRVHLFPKFTPGQTLRYQIETRTSCEQQNGNAHRESGSCIQIEADRQPDPAARNSESTARPITTLPEAFAFALPTKNPAPHLKAMPTIPQAPISRTNTRISKAARSNTPSSPDGQLFTSWRNRRSARKSICR